MARMEVKLYQLLEQGCHQCDEQADWLDELHQHLDDLHAHLAEQDSRPALDARMHTDRTSRLYEQIVGEADSTIQQTRAELRRCAAQLASLQQRLQHLYPPASLIGVVRPAAEASQQNQVGEQSVPPSLATINRAAELHIIIEGVEHFIHALALMDNLEQIPAIEEITLKSYQDNLVLLYVRCTASHSCSDVLPHLSDAALHLIEATADTLHLSCLA